MAVGGGDPTGIELFLTFDATDTLEVYRDTSSGFGTELLVAELVGGDQYWIDALPLDGTSRYYRARPKNAITTGSYVNLGSPTGYKPTTLLA